MSKMNSAMAGASAGAAAGPVGAAVGGVAGYLMGSDDKSSKLYDQMMLEASQLSLPQLKEYFPELYQQVVSLNPELETAVTLGPSEMQGISTDPELRKAQLNALAKLTEIGDAGGRDSQFLSDQARLENDINNQLQGQQGAIEQNMAARGMSGGMSELVARNMATQNASNQYAQTAMDAKAQADKRALEAIMNAGTMGGQMQSQDFAQQSARAQAQDAINKFNAQNQQQVISQNTANKNNAQQWNAQQAQTAANSNVDARNQAQQYNTNQQQQQFNNKLAKLGLSNNAASAAAQNSANQAARQDQFLGGMFSSAAKAYGTSQANKKDEE